MPPFSVNLCRSENAVGAIRSMLVRICQGHPYSDVFSGALMTWKPDRLWFASNNAVVVAKSSEASPRIIQGKECARERTEEVRHNLQRRQRAFSEILEQQRRRGRDVRGIVCPHLRAGTRVRCSLSLHHGAGAC